MSKGIWRDCKKQPPLVDDGELVLMDSNDRFWVGFCKITSDGVSYFANNAEPLKNDFVKYVRVEKLLELVNENKDLSDKIGKLQAELERTRKALGIAVDTLHWYDDNYDSVVARNTLDEIKTALEQKEHFADTSKKIEQKD